MIKNKLAINVFEKFIEENDRLPECQEFIALGYCRSTYYNIKKFYLEEQASKAVKEALRNEAVKGKI